MGSQRNSASDSAGLRWGLRFCSSAKSPGDAQPVDLPPWFEKESSRALIVVHWIKMQLLMPASHIRVPIWVLAALLVIQLPANTPGKAMNDGPST